MCEPSESYTAGAFYRDALGVATQAHPVRRTPPPRFSRPLAAAPSQVLERGRVPIFVGGTSMYLHWCAARRDAAGLRVRAATKPTPRRLVNGRPTAPRTDPGIAERARLLLAPHEGERPT
jgi:hypothetical protein